MAENPVKFSDLFDPLGPGAQELKDFTTAIQSLSRNYKAFAKTLDSDGERVKALMAGVVTQAGTIREQAASINLLNEKERVGLAALSTQITQLIREQQRLAEVQAAQAKVQTRIKDATTEATSALRAMQNELREAYAAKDTARIEKAALALRGARAETLSLSAALRGANSEFSAARGSYDALDAENKKLIASLKALEGGIGSGSGEALRLQKQIAANTQTLKAFDENILVFNRNVGNYQGGFAELTAELAKARAAQAAMTAGSEDYNRQQIKVTGFQTAAQKSAAQMGLSYEQAEAKIAGVTAAVQPLATALVRLEQEQRDVAKTAGEESEAFRKIGFQIQSTKKQLDDVAVATSQVETKQGGLTQQLGFSKEGLQQYVTQLAVGYVGLQALMNGIEAVFNANVEYSRNLAEVRKTTGLTADEAERLTDSLKALDTPTSLAGLLKIASVGGQLGVAKDDLLGFTQAIDTAVQALGNDFTGGAEEIATVLGRLGTVYRRELGPDQAQNILAIGSAINQLAADGSATAPFLTDVALRIGAIAASTRLGLDNGLAYAAVLQEQGYAAEVSGTALNRLFSTLSTKTKEAYDIAKLANPALTLKDFTHLVNTDFNQAIQVFLRGLNEGGKSTTQQAALLKTLKLQSGEAKSAIVTLAQNTELFAQRQKTANDQLRDATSLAAEATINTETLAGSVDKSTNAVKNFFTTGAAASVLKFLVDVEGELFKIVGEPFRLIGDGLAYIGEKVGLVDKPLENYTANIVDNVLATRKQAAAQQALLQSYINLQNTTARSATQELELAQTRAKLLKEFGSADVAVVQATIDTNAERADNVKRGLQRDLVELDSAIAQTTLRAAQAQQAVNKVPELAKLSAERLEELKRVAARHDDSYFDGTTTREAAKAIASLGKAEKDLAEQQRNRANLVAGLAKLGEGAIRQKKEDVDATQEQEKAEEQLDRAALERAKNRLAILRDELADNQQRITAAREYQQEQAKLFADRQVTEQLFAEAVAGSQEYITQKERNGAAIRIRIARAEASEKLIVADNERIQSRNKKDISEAELNTIQAKYATQSVEIARVRAHEIEKISDDLAKRLANDEKPLEFKVAAVDPSKLFANQNLINYETETKRISEVQKTADAENLQRLVNRDITQKEFYKQQRKNRQDADKQELEIARIFHKNEREAQRQQNEGLQRDREEDLQKRLALIDKVGEYAQFAEQSFFQIKSNFLDAQAQNEQQAYETSLAAAGDNAALKTQIEQKHQKELKRIAYEKAKAERDAAIFSIAINTAVAVAKSIAESPETFGLPFSAVALAVGLVQEAVVLSKPLPAYFKGRAGGPAETALVGERGAELIGQPSTGYRLATKPTITYLQAGDHVFTAPETRQILAQNEFMEARFEQRAQQADIQRQTERLRAGAAQRQAEAQAAFDRSNGQVLAELRQVRRAIEQQEYYRLNENDDLVRRSHRENGWQDYVNRRYKHGRG